MASRKDNTAEMRAHDWANRVANGKKTVAQIPNDIQARTLELTYDALKNTGIRVITAGSVLYPILRVLNDQNAGVESLESALQAIASVHDALTKRYNVLVESRYTAEVEFAEKKRKEGVK